MNRKAFFDALRGGPLFPRLSQDQVVGIEALLDEIEARHDDWTVPEAANVLAQVHHETGGGMYPRKETVYAHSRDKNPSDAEVIRRLDAAWARGQLTWVRQPYWREGWFGRGQIQITHVDNYAKMGPVVGADLVGDPSRALDPQISARIACRGMARGLFTGRKLADYRRAEGYDHHGARRIVNGDVPAIGPTLARNGPVFEAALRAAGGVR